MAIGVFNRYESKYLLDKETYVYFYKELLNYMEFDDHNKDGSLYSITNVYFDTENDALIRKSLSKPKYKEKLRIRSYGIPNSDDIIFLELKKKVFDLVNKRRTKIRLSDVNPFISNGLLPKEDKFINKQILSEISYFLTQYKLLPKVYIAYERIALFSKGSRDLRITFDTNIRTRRSDVTLDSGDHGEHLLETGQVLMEIKSEKTIPIWLSNLLSKHSLYRTSFSKYGNEYKKNIRGNK